MMARTSNCTLARPRTIGLLAILLAALASGAVAGCSGSGSANENSSPALDSGFGQKSRDAELARLQERITKEYTCDRTVKIDEPGPAVIGVKGSCSRINVAGDNLTILPEYSANDLGISGSGNYVLGSANDIKISGSSNKVWASTVSRLKISGSNNSIIWDAAKWAPKVYDAGDDNVMKGK